MKHNNQPLEVYWKRYNNFVGWSKAQTQQSLYTQQSQTMQPHWIRTVLDDTSTQQSEDSALCQVGSVQELAYFRFYVLFGVDHKWLGINFNNKYLHQHQPSAIKAQCFGCIINVMVFNYLIYIDFIYYINQFNGTGKYIHIRYAIYVLFLFWIIIVALSCSSCIFAFMCSVLKCGFCASRCTN